MKHRFIYLIVCIVLTLSCECQVQAGEPARTRPTDELFTRYSGRKGFTNISYGSEMLSMMAAKTSDRDISDLIGSIRLIRVLIADDSISAGGIISLTKDVTSIAKTYTLVSTVKEDGKDIRFFFTSAKGGDAELVMVSTTAGKVSVLDILGDFSVKDISRLSAISATGKKAEAVSGGK